jgi:hypothetical protein
MDFGLGTRNLGECWVSSNMVCWWKDKFAKAYLNVHLKWTHKIKNWIMTKIKKIKCIVTFWELVSFADLRLLCQITIIISMSVLISLWTNNKVHRPTTLL